MGVGPPATSAEVAQLATDSKTGYCQGRPPVPRTNGAKLMGQKLHRMAILALHDAAAFQLLMFRSSAGDRERYEVSSKHATIDITKTAGT